MAVKQKTTKKNSLKKYQAKRHFDISPEPKGTTAKKKSIRKHKPIFVVHEHAARSLHYDIRLEAGGVLKSWAVPKGPSTDPQEKHLAVQTEDHPFEYRKFEGTIPEGEYGAGPVIIWDKGTFRSLKEGTLEDNIKNGTVAVWFDGKKLKGGYAFVKTKFSENSWLFFKMKDEYADADHELTKEKPKSVVSHKTIEQMGKKNGSKSKKSDRQAIIRRSKKA